MSPVWENPNGDRVHCGGLLRKADGTCVNWCDPRYSTEMRLAEIMQPGCRRIRALLLWAELILNPTNDERMHHYQRWRTSITGFGL
jgi:hypothetical protein